MDSDQALQEMLSYNANKTTKLVICMICIINYFLLALLHNSESISSVKQKALPETPSESYCLNHNEQANYGIS